MTEKIKIMIVDDHDMVRKGLKAYLSTEENIEIVGEASSGNQAVRSFESLRPEVILMDLIMEDGNGIEATKQILAKAPLMKVIILTSFYDDEQVFPAIEAGAMSYLLKTASSEEIIQAIHKAHRGKTVIDGKVAQKLVAGLRKSPQPFDQLTAREKEVLRLIADGKNNAEIAATLFIGIKTVKTHVSSIFSKLDVADRTQAAVYAYQNHLFTK
ncbi:response regulator [Sporolactobacillus nakayamae]|uniref:Two component transcriptional regulator, LuxR family n=1 Tax=Sporolactobacillus nakayamae TaxID=269670 RepID=A0A1I2VQ98_9BACL|nr:response regulator transcription factor [Sporolactobacillus nakayamae]SFG91505.1 two component transcriptional regulator, LuxR family [Sporolactobacillus nakayamae]